MWRRVSYFFIFLVSITIARTNGKYRYDYSFDKEAGGWLKLHEAPATFMEAFLHCNLEGAVLASPLNDGILKAMVNKLAESDVNCGIYTGIHATISKTDFTSVEGVPLAKIPVTWAPEEPDNFEDQEDCIIMLQNGTMADFRCNDTFPFVCYRKRVSTPVITSCGTVDPGYKLETRTGSCYKFHNVAQTWRRAQMTCLAEGGYLAIINTDTEANVLVEIFGRYPDSTITESLLKDHVSIGFLDWDKNRSWFTVNGQSLEAAGWSNWLAGHPNNDKTYDDGQYCGSMVRNGLLDDIWCESTPFAFICEKSTDSLVDYDDE